MGFIERSTPQSTQEVNIKPLAIISGEIVHIVYPDGEVEATTQAEINDQKTKYPLYNCLVWGELELL